MPDFHLSPDHQRTLLHVARETISYYLKNDQIPSLKLSEYHQNLTSFYGVFVTLLENGKLRGCIGKIESQEPLVVLVQKMAIASAFQDKRFSPLTTKEFKSTEIEISLLSPLKKISSIEEIELGLHGIYIRKDFFSGTYLPQVATNTGWTKEEFLGHCARDKAGIGWNGWIDADIFIYKTMIFSEKDIKNEP